MTAPLPSVCKCRCCLSARSHVAVATGLIFLQCIQALNVTSGYNLQIGKQSKRVNVAVFFSASRVTVKFLAQQLICLLLIRISPVTGFQGHVAYCFIDPLEGFSVHNYKELVTCRSVYRKSESLFNN